MAAPRPKQSTGQKGALTFKQQLAGMCCLFLCFFLCSQFGCTLDSGYVSVQENVLPDNSQAALGHAFDTLTKWTEWSQWNSVWTSDVVGLSPHAAVGDLAWVGLNVGQRLTMRFRVLESDRLAHRFCWTLQLLPVYELQSLLLKTGRCTQLVYDGATRRVLMCVFVCKRHAALCLTRGLTDRAMAPGGPRTRILVGLDSWCARIPRSRASPLTGGLPRTCASGW
jgi:hypothetical protein